MKYFMIFSKVSNIDQTGSEIIGKMRLCLMTCLSHQEMFNKYEYSDPCQRAILFLHR